MCATTAPALGQLPHSQRALCVSRLLRRELRGTSDRTGSVEEKGRGCDPPGTPAYLPARANPDHPRTTGPTGVGKEALWPPGHQEGEAPVEAPPGAGGFGTMSLFDIIIKTRLSFE